MKKILDIGSVGNEYKDCYLIYNRKSTDDIDNQKNSIEYQKRENIKFASDKSIKLANITIDGFCSNGIIDEHHSGFKLDDEFEILDDGSIKQKISRPKFLKLIQLLQSKKIRGVIFLCWDRASRNEQDDMLIKQLIRQGCDLRFTQTDYDKSSSGALHQDIDSVMARHISRVISEKVKLARKKLIEDKRCTYPAPIGYLNKGSDNKPFDTERAPIVKEIFEKFAEGGWSYSTIAQWARQKGLTTKPSRRKRTPEEKARNVSKEDIPQISRPVEPKTMENMLSNPFYIGKIVDKGVWKDSKAHLPLVDTLTFYKVQEKLKEQCVSVHYPELDFKPYRGIIRCGICKSAYSPYIKKGILFYKVKCKSGCTNNHRNFNFEFVNNKIKEVLEKIHFTDDEVERINKEADKELNKIGKQRNDELDTLNRQLKKFLDDFDYLSKERLTLMRTGGMTIQQIKDDEIRLTSEIEKIKERINEKSIEAKEMLNYILTFSELMQNAVLYFTYALDTEKQEIISQIFTELLFANREMKYQANEGFSELLSRHKDPNWESGSL